MQNLAKSQELALKQIQEIINLRPSVFSNPNIYAAALNLEKETISRLLEKHDMEVKMAALQCIGEGAGEGK